MYQKKILPKRYIQKRNSCLLYTSIVLTKYRIAIFCDSEFFHGKDWEILKPRLEKGKNPDYWVKKIERNIQRDEEKDQKLNFMGWTVIHFWGKDILKDTEQCVKVIEETIFDQKLEEVDDEDVYKRQEYDSFIAGIEPESEDYLIFEILFWTGIREGELLALSLSDFDMSGNLLHINKTYNRIRKRDVIDTPKTENSVRTIDIPNFLKEEVQEYAKKHYGFPENQRLFPIVARTLQKRLKKYEALTGVKPIRVHDIRHSHVAYLIYQGVEPLIIKERLGHKDIQMTDVYKRQQ